MTAQLVDAAVSMPARPRLRAVAPVREVVPAVDPGLRARVASPEGASDAAWLASAVARVQAVGLAPDEGAEWVQPVLLGEAAIRRGSASAPAAAESGWQLTQRGMVVAVALTLAAITFMMATMVSAFLAVSDAPPAADVSSVTLALDGAPAPA